MDGVGEADGVQLVLTASCCLSWQVRQYLDFFRQSGKFSVAYLNAGGEKVLDMFACLAPTMCPAWQVL